MKINFYGTPLVSNEQVESHRASALARGLPLHTERARDNPGPLAVVGSGPSIRDHLAELQAWPGDIWGINGAARWLRERGVDATLFSSCWGEDWGDDIGHYTRGVTRAVLSWSCSPKFYDALAGADIVVAKIGEAGCETATTSATATPMLALGMGYRKITFFGCESSFTEDTTHVDRDIDVPNWLIVACGGTAFRTNAQMLMQAEQLGKIIREFPVLMAEKSGGLLRAMVENEDWNVLLYAPLIHQAIETEAQRRKEMT